MKKLTITTLALVCASAIHALPMNSTVVLPVPNNGMIAANDGLLEVSLDKLKKEVYYNVTCKFLNSADTGVDMQFNSNDLMQYPQYATLNNHNISFLQDKLKSGENTYKAFHLQTSSSSSFPRKPVLKFRNLDNDIAVLVTSCFAEPTIE